MTHESLSDEDWKGLLERLGGADGLAASARATGAFRRARRITSATDLLRLILAYCLGERGLRATAAWAAAVGLADLSNVALLGRLQRCGDWLALLVERALMAEAPAAASGRLLRLVDATTVPKAGRDAKRNNGLWRVHSAFELPAERFGFLALTEESEGERIDRIPVVPGEIRIGGRAYLQPERMARVLEAGADLLVRAGWKNARWCEAGGRRLDLSAVLAGTAGNVIDRPIFIDRGRDLPALALRLVAVRKPPAAAEAAREATRRAARRERYQISAGTLIAAEWVILVTSLDEAAFPTADVLALYRLRWRIELAFKRLKSLVGLKGPPGTDARSARPWLLAHLLAILLLEPLVDAFEDSPRSAAAA
jgi:hypothetical protein